MGFDIKKIAIALGCAGVVVFIIGRINSGSDTSNYQPITSLAHLDQSEALQFEEISQSVTIENAKRLPGQLVATMPVAETSMPLAETAMPLLEIATPLVETDNQLSLDQPEMLETIEDDSDMLMLEITDDSIVDIPAPAHLDTLQADTATEPMLQEPMTQEPMLQEPMAQKPKTPQAEVRDARRRSFKGSWKKNPFLSNNTPSFESETRDSSSSMVRPASMAMTTQAVRSLNEISGIPNQAPASAPTAVPTPITPEIHPSGSMVSAGSPIGNSILGNQNIAPLQMQLPEAAAQKAVHHIEYGKSLTRRGASYAARHEFFSALRVIAEANDAGTNGNDFSMALSKAIRAMKEAEDFNVNDAQSFAIIDVPATIESHKTKLLTDLDARRITPLKAMQRYYAYAGQQLDFAGGRNIVSAEALHCLGKLHSVISSQQPGDSKKSDIAQAIVFHQSSLLSNSNNPASSNELGVLLAKSGNLQGATELFKQSLISQPTPQAWSNLAKTHQRLGEQGMAQMAQAEIAVAAQSTSIATAGIKWIDTPQFNAMAPLEFEPRIARKTTTAALPQPAKATEKDEKSGSSIAERIKKWF